MEGNRGLFDGVDVAGSYSTAELASILGLPVLLVVDCTKMTRTVAALILGCRAFDPNLSIKGCVLNRIGSGRHEKIIRQAVEQYTDVRVVGALPRQKRDIFPQRHIGITPCPEFDGAADAVNRLAELVRENVDLHLVEELMVEIAIPADPEGQRERERNSAEAKNREFRVGVLKDAAFQFYYPDNLHDLEARGAKLVEINALEAEELPELDGLYIGGGFPETSARQLAGNTAFLKSIRGAIENGLPVYAECGGLIYLGQGMRLAGEYFPLVGIFPVVFEMMEKPQAHGYTVLEVAGENPFYEKGTQIKGHEFRYSKVAEWSGDSKQLTLSMKRGVGFIDGRDGLVYKNTLALYTHIHALGTPDWAESFIRRVRKEISGQ
jgi:cobyrinic acid a,c-diamide synthase